MNFIQIFAQDLHKSNMASVYAKSVKTICKLDIIEKIQSQSTHWGCFGHFQIYIGQSACLESAE